MIDKNARFWYASEQIFKHQEERKAGEMENCHEPPASSTESFGESRMHIIERGEDGVRRFTFEGKEIAKGFTSTRDGFVILRENHESGYLNARLTLIGLTRLVKEWGIIEFDEMRLRRGRRRGRIITIGRLGQGRFIFMCNGEAVDTSAFTDAQSGVALVRQLHLGRVFNEGERNQAFNRLALMKDTIELDKQIFEFEQRLRRDFKSLHHEVFTEAHA